MKDLTKQAKEMTELAKKLGEHQDTFRQEVDKALEERRRQLDKDLEGPFKRLERIAEQR